MPTRLPFLSPVRCQRPRATPGTRRGKIARFPKGVRVGFCANVMRVGPVVARRPWGVTIAGERSSDPASPGLPD